jgi:hypothetical protein
MVVVEGIVLVGNLVKPKHYVLKSAGIDLAEC